jgi:hypothetical protein
MIKGKTRRQPSAYRETHLTQSTAARETNGGFLGLKLGALIHHPRKHVCKYEPLSWVRVIRHGEAVLDTTLRVRANQAGEGLHDQLADLCFALRDRALGKARVEDHECEWVKDEVSLPARSRTCQKFHLTTVGALHQR